MLAPQDRRDGPFIRTLNVDTTNRPGTFRHIGDAIDAVEDGIRTLIVVAAGTYELNQGTLTIGGSSQSKFKKALDVEIRGAADAIPVLTSKQTALHVALPSPHQPTPALGAGPSQDAQKALPPLFVVTGIRIESSNPLFPAVLVTGGAPLFFKASIQSMHLDNDATYAYIDTCKITDSPSNGIMITGGASCEIKKCEFRRALLYNMLVECTTSPLVTGCSFFESGKGAMVICGNARCAPVVAKCIFQDLPLNSSASMDDTGAIQVKGHHGSNGATSSSSSNSKADALESSGGDAATISSATIVEGSPVPRAAIVVGAGTRPTIEDNTIFGGTACGVAVYASATYLPHRVVSLDVVMLNVNSVMSAKRAFVAKKKKGPPPALAAMRGLLVAGAGAAPSPEVGLSSPTTTGEGDAPDAEEATASSQPVAVKQWKLGDLDSLPRGDPSTKIRKNVIRDNAMYGVLVQGDSASFSISRCEVNRNGQGGCVAEDDGKMFVYSSIVQQHSTTTSSNTSSSAAPSSSADNRQPPLQRVPGCWAKEGTRSLIRLNDCKIEQNQIGCLAEHGARVVFEYACVVEDCECGVLVRHSGLVDAVDAKFHRSSVAVSAESCGGGLIQRCVVESNGVGYASHSGGNPMFQHTPFRRNGTAIDVGTKGRGGFTHCTISDSTGSVSQIILGERADPTVSHCDVKSASASAIVCRPLCRGTISHCTFTGHKGAEVVRFERACEVTIEHCRFIGAERNALVFHEGAGGSVLNSEISSAMRAGVLAKALAEPTLRGNKIHFNSIGVELLPASVVMLEKNSLAENSVANIQTSGVVSPPPGSSGGSGGIDLTKLPVRADWQPYLSTVSKNEIIGGQFGVQVLAGARTIISRNVFLRCPFGVYVGAGQADASRVTCAGNEFRRNNCAIALLGGPTTAGVFIGNVIRESGACGMWVGAGTQPTVLDNIFMGHCTTDSTAPPAAAAPTQHPAKVTRSTSPPSRDDINSNNTQRLCAVPLRLDPRSGGSYGRNRFLFNDVCVVAHPTTLAVLTQNYYAQNEIGFVYSSDAKRFLRRQQGVSPTSTAAGALSPTDVAIAPPTSSGVTHQPQKPSAAPPQAGVKRSTTGLPAEVDIGTPPDLPTVMAAGSSTAGSSSTLQSHLPNYIDTTVLDIQATLGGMLDVVPPRRTTHDASQMNGSADGGIAAHRSLPPMVVVPEALKWAIPLDDDNNTVGDIGIDESSTTSPATAVSKGEEDLGGPILLGEHFVENCTGVLATAQAIDPPLCLDGCVFLNSKIAGVEVVHKVAVVRVTNCLFHASPLAAALHQSGMPSRHSEGGPVSDDSARPTAKSLVGPQPQRHHILFSGADETLFVFEEPHNDAAAGGKLKQAAKSSTSGGAFSAVVANATTQAKAAAASAKGADSRESSLREGTASLGDSSRRMRSVVAHCVFYGTTANVTFDHRHTSASLFGCSFVASGVRSLRESFPIVAACSFIGNPAFVKKLVDAHYCKSRVDYVTDPTSMMWCLEHGAFERTSRMPIARDSFVGTRAVHFAHGGGGAVTQCTISLYQEGVVFNDAKLLAVPPGALGPISATGGVAAAPASPGGSQRAIGQRDGSLLDGASDDAALAATLSFLSAMVNRCVIVRCRDAAVLLGNGGINDEVLDTSNAPPTTQSKALDRCVIANNYGVGLLVRGRCGGSARTTVQPFVYPDALVRSPTAGRFTAVPSTQLPSPSTATPRKTSSGVHAVLPSPSSAAVGAQVYPMPVGSQSTSTPYLVQRLLIAGHAAVPLLPHMLQPPLLKSTSNVSHQRHQTAAATAALAEEQVMRQQAAKEREVFNGAAIEAHSAEAKAILLCNVQRDRAYNGSEKNPQQPPTSSLRYPVRYGLGSHQHHQGHGVGVWVDASGTLALHNCAVVGSMMANVIFASRMPSGLSRCLVTQAVGFGVVVRGGASPVVLHSLIGQNGYAGALLDAGSKPSIEHSLFMGNRIGLYAAAVDDATKLRWCTFHHHDICAVRAVEGARFIVDRCAVEYNRGGIDIAASPVLVRACTVLHNRNCGVVISSNCGVTRKDKKGGHHGARHNHHVPSQVRNNVTGTACGRAEATIISCVLRGNQIAGIALRNGAIASSQKCLIENNALSGIMATNFSLLRCVECTLSKNGVGVISEWGTRGLVTQCLFTKNIDRAFLSKTSSNLRVAGNLFLEDAPVGVCLEGKGTFTSNTFRKPKSNCFIVSQGGEPRILNTRFVLLHGGTTDILHAKLLEERNLDTMMNVILPTHNGNGQTPPEGEGLPPGGRGLLDRIKAGTHQHYLELSDQLGAFVMPVDHQLQSDDGSGTPFLASALGGGVSPPMDPTIPSLASALQSPQPMPPLPMTSPGAHTSFSSRAPSRIVPVAPSAFGSDASRPTSTVLSTHASMEMYPPPPDVSGREDDGVELGVVDGRMEREFGAFERAEMVARTSVTALRRRSSVAVHRTEKEAARRKSYSELHQSNIDIDFGSSENIRNVSSPPPDIVPVGRGGGSPGVGIRGNTPSTVTSPTNLAGSTSSRPRRQHRASFFLPADDEATSKENNNSVVSGASSAAGQKGMPRALSLKNLRQRRISSHRLDVDYMGGSRSVGGGGPFQQQQHQPLTQLQKDLISDQRDDILAASSALAGSGRDDSAASGAYLISGSGGGGAGDGIALMDHNKVPIVFEGGGGGVVARCIFAHNQPCSILCDGPGALPTIETSLFYDHRLCAVVVTGNAGAKIEQNYFTRNANAVQSFYADGPKLLLEKNLFRFNLAAFEALEGDCGTIRHSSHLQDEHSILCGSGAVVKIQESSFVGCDDAIVGEPNSILLLDHVDMLGCIEAITLQSDEPTTVNPVGHADDTTEVLRHVSVRCCVNGIRIGNRRDVQVQNCTVDTCALVGIELTAPPSSSILSNVPSSVMVVDTNVQGCRTGIVLDGEACMPIFGSSTGGTGGDGTTSFYGAAALAATRAGGGGCAVTFCGTGVTVTNGSVPRMEHLSIRQCVKGVMVSQHATGLFRKLEISGCDAGVLISTGDEEYPSFQHCLIYDCPIVGVYFDRRAAGQVIDSTIFECGVGVMFTEGSYSYLAHTKVSHPSNNSITKKNDALRVAKFAGPRLGPNIDLQYQSSPSHNSRTSRMRRIDREKEREVYQEESVPTLMKEWDAKKAFIVAATEAFLESYGMKGRCMVTLPLQVVTTVTAPDESLMMHASSVGRFSGGGSAATPSSGHTPSSHARGHLFGASGVDADRNTATHHNNAPPKVMYAVEAAAANNGSGSVGTPAEFAMDVVAGAPPPPPYWSPQSTREKIFEQCTECDAMEAAVMLLSGQATTKTPPDAKITTNPARGARTPVSPPPIASLPLHVKSTATNTTLPISVPQPTASLPPSIGKQGSSNAVKRTGSFPMQDAFHGDDDDQDQLVTAVSTSSVGEGGAMLDGEEVVVTSDSHLALATFPLPPLPTVVGSTWTNRLHKDEAPLADGGGRGGGGLGGGAPRHNQSNYALDAILKERSTAVVSPPLAQQGGGSSGHNSSGDESDDMSDDDIQQQHHSNNASSASFSGGGATRGNNSTGVPHRENDDAHPSLFAAHLRRRGSDIATIYTVRELRTMEDHAEDDVAISLGLYHRHASAAGEALPSSLPLLPPFKAVPPPGKPYFPTAASLQFAEAAQLPASASSPVSRTTLPPLPSQRTLRLLQRPQTNLLTPLTADELAHVTTQHNSIYAHQVLTAFTRLDARRCGGVTASDCRRYFKQLIARCEGTVGGDEDTSGSSGSSGEEEDAAQLSVLSNPFVEEALPGGKIGGGERKKKKKQKKRRGSNAKRRRSSVRKVQPPQYVPLVDGLSIPAAILSEAQQQQRRRMERKASTASFLSVTTDAAAAEHSNTEDGEALDDHRLSKSAVPLLPPQKLDAIVLKLVIHQFFESLKKVPETDTLSLAEFEQLLSAHQRWKQTGRLPAAIRAAFPWMGMPQPMVEGGLEETAASSVPQQLFGGMQQQHRNHAEDSRVVPVGRGALSRV